MAGLKRGQFYIIAAYLMVVLLAAAVSVYTVSAHRTQQKIERAGQDEAVFEEVKRELVYVVRMDPLNTTRLDDFIGYAGWYASGKGLSLNVTYSVGPLLSYCDAFYNCTSDCTNTTLLSITLQSDYKRLEKNVSVCWK